jgi:hypothetical protein
MRKFAAQFRRAAIESVKEHEKEESDEENN